MMKQIKQGSHGTLSCLGYIGQNWSKSRAIFSALCHWFDFKPNAFFLLGVFFSITIFTNKAVASAVVRHDFSGVITDADFNNGDPFAGQIQVGSLFNGFYEFDGNQTPAVGSACQDRLEQCSREFSIPTYSFSVTVGSITFDGLVELEIVVNDGVSGVSDDFYNVYTHVDFAGSTAFTILSLSDTTLTAIDDPQSLYIDPPDLAYFTDYVFQINDGGGIGNIQGQLDTFTPGDVIEVPEPATLTVFVFGLAGLGFMRRLQRRRAY